MKNPKNRPLRLVRHASNYRQPDDKVGPVLAQLAVAESNLVRAGKDSALPHFIAIVKELERIYGFHFEQIPDETETPDLRDGIR